MEHFGAVFVFVLGVSCVSSQVVDPVKPVLLTIAPGCYHEGKHYAIGENFQTNPCSPCYCGRSGQVSCAIVDCFFTPCVDSIHDPKHCCPTCPNGENCKHSDGTIIKKGDTYRPDPNTVCQCPVNSFGFRGSMAICVHSDPTLAPLVVS